MYNKLFIIFSYVRVVYIVGKIHGSKMVLMLVTYSFPEAFIGFIFAKST